MADISEEVLFPVGRILLDLRKLRESAYDDLIKLPAADPMKEVLARVNRVLGHTEDAIIRAAKRPPGVDPLKYIQSQMRELEEEIRREQAIPGEKVTRKLLPARRRLKSP